MEQASLEEMARDADAIVLGTVERNGVQMMMRPGGLEPQTVSRVRVRRWLKGDGGQTVTIRELGGQWRGGGMRIDGTPQYREGQEIVVFLEAHPSRDGDFRTYAMVQGKFVVVRGAPGVPDLVRRDTTAVAFADWAEDGMTVRRGEQGPAMQLTEFLSLVRRYVSPHAGGGSDAVDALGGVR